MKTIAARPRRSLVRRALMVSLGATLCLAACPEEEKKDDGKTAEAKDGDKKDGDKKDADEGKDDAKPGEGGDGGPAADAINPASKLQRGDVLAHVMLPNPSGFIKEIKEKAAPSAAAMFLDENMLRNLASGQLGSRANVAKNLDLGKPLGCVLVDSKVVQAPVACVVGYNGGAEKAVTDLGNDGKQADAAGHAGFFKIEGEDVYLDDLGGAVVISNHAEVFAKAKPYLESNIVGRGDKVVSDVEVVAYGSGIVERYSEELKPVLAELSKPPAVGGKDNKMAEAFAAYSQKSTQDSIKRITEIDQLTIGVGLEEVGFVGRYAMFPQEGSDLQKMVSETAAGPMDPEFTRQLPAGTWGLIGMKLDPVKMWENPSTVELRDLLIDAYAEATKKDAAAVKSSVEAYFNEVETLYGKDMAWGLMHEPGTLGGLVVATRIAEGKNPREHWQKWAEGFKSEDILGPEASKDLTWTFKMDAATVDGVPVDHWIIEPTEERKKKLRKEGGAELKKWEPRMGGLKLTIARADVDGVSLLVIAPGSEDKYVEKAIKAVKGTGNLKGDKGLDFVLGRHPSTGGVFALDVKGGAAWLKDLMPPEEAGQIPPNLGNDLSDFFVVGSYSKKTGSQSGEIVMSQALIDQIRALAN